MADDDATRLKTITDNIEAMYQSLRLAAGNISGLLQGGQATCDEVKAYNLWALATYNTQRGMLDTLRAGGESGIPDLPTPPTLFAWAGVEGFDALNLDCSGQASSLGGLMKRAMSGPTPTTQYLSTNQIQIVTQDPHVFNPAQAPSFKTLLAVQQARQQQAMAGLGFPLVLIVIAAIVVSVSVAITAIMHYLDVNAVQEANTEQTKIQADAFATYTQARLACMQQCSASGKSVEDCTETCKQLVTPPNIKLPGQMGSWGSLQWIGFFVVAGAGSYAAYKLYQRHKAGKPVFELPEAIAP